MIELPEYNSWQISVTPTSLYQQAAIKNTLDD